MQDPSVPHLEAGRDLTPGSNFDGDRELTLGFGRTFPDLYCRLGLEKVDTAFLVFLGEADAALRAELATGRCTPDALGNAAESALILKLALHLERFIAELFGIKAEVLALARSHDELTSLYRVKRKFVQRRAAAAIGPADAARLDIAAIEARLEACMNEAVTERSFAAHVDAWLAQPTRNVAELDLAVQYAAWALHAPAGRARHGAGVLFKQPTRRDAHLLPASIQRVDHDGRVSHRIAPERLRRREGFALTDPGMNLVGALDQAHYCIWCHAQAKDSCSKGLREAAAADAPQQPAFKKSPAGVTLAGCPLEEKISEFQFLKARGVAIGALAVIAIDNPLVAATGHRICNDCMKSCIYQKQDPVDIPQVETRTLKDVLELPWGFEIYSLLTRWNPLDLRRPLPRSSTGYKVLIAGLGPAGFSLAHHLMNEGHDVVGVDGLKIEPLPPEISGVRVDGSRAAFQPIRDVRTLLENLGTRVTAGFGGVAEYGITVRWDKNFLKIVRLLLERRAQFAMYGGVRFGGTVTLQDAWDLGFDHVALCMGAGKPTMLDIPNGLARGVRMASDFLMALQLTGAAKADSLASMQVRLPVVVIGGGLTAIDTATESLAYYAVQVERFLARCEELAATDGVHAWRAHWADDERETAEEFIAHARAIREERAAARAERRAPRIVELLQSWGGATIAYRRRLAESPAHSLNHEEVEKALEEGIAFAECLTPIAVRVDTHGRVSAICFEGQRDESVGAGPMSAKEHCLPARTIFVAAGTQPNTVLAREDPEHFALDGRYFRACDEDGNQVRPQRAISKPERADVLLAKHADGRFVSFFGDLHPSFFGNVVKAFGSTKQGYPVISRVLRKRPPALHESGAQLFARLDADLRARVHAVRRLAPGIVEVVVRAPRAARNFRPGQFYRLQNYETLAPVRRGARMQMEGLALTGAWVDAAAGLVSIMVLETGGSSDLCTLLAPGEPIVLMGPTGTATEIRPDETAVLVGGGLGNAVLFSIGAAFRRAGSKVLYFAGYKRLTDRVKIEEIETAADVVVWCCDEAPGLAPRRPADRSFVGNVVQAMMAYATGQLGAQPIGLRDADRMIVIGSDRMMQAVAQARRTTLYDHLNLQHTAIASINSPMQCMMKEICAQCLQPHRDPHTGARSHVFSCFNQDQPLDSVDFPALTQRLGQNSLSEKLTAAWIRHCLEQ